MFWFLRVCVSIQTIKPVNTYILKHVYINLPYYDDRQSTRPGGIAFPPLLFGGTFVAGLLLQVLFPTPVLDRLPALLIGGAFVLIGLPIADAVAGVPARDSEQHDLLVPLLIVVPKGIIEREEQYLTCKFGDE